MIPTANPRTALAALHRARVELERLGTTDRDRRRVYDRLAASVYEAERELHALAGGPGAAA